ncbi:hypothetical protein CG471_11760 [Sphingobium sp. IP1]|nr:hypothetical protein CG471_11760 [Sphingobium sp. IP1]
MSVIAAAAVSAARFVGMLTGAHCAAGAKAQGVSQYAASTGEAFAVDVLGTTIVEAGGAVAAGAAVEADAQARAITRTTGEINGWAVTGASAAGQKIEVLLKL